MEHRSLRVRVCVYVIASVVWLSVLSVCCHASSIQLEWNQAGRAHLQLDLVLEDHDRPQIELNCNPPKKLETLINNKCFEPDATMFSLGEDTLNRFISGDKNWVSPPPCNMYMAHHI